MPEYQRQKGTIIRRIALCEDDYLDYHEKNWDRGADQVEPELLAKLEGYLPSMIDVFDELDPRERPRRSGELVLESLYHRWTVTSGEDVPMLRALIGAFIATETEREGMFRLHRAQQATMAAHYEAIAAEFTRLGFHRHAALAYHRAADLYLILQDSAKRDGCLLEQARAKHRTTAFGRRRIMESVNDQLCGYGYEPYKLLRWMLFQLVFFTALVAALSPHQEFVVSLHACLVNFLNPLGLGDATGFTGAASVMLVVESFAGAASMNVFFALLVRKWFQA